MVSINEMLTQLEASGDRKHLNDEIDKAFRKAARDLYQEDGSIEIDDNAVVSLDEGSREHPLEGGYVAAWVWVPRDYEE